MRTDVNGAGSGRDAHESFRYDELNRLTWYQTTNPDGQTQNVTLAYNAIGNILSKSDVGSYIYPASGQRLPHAVTSIRARAGGPTYNADYEYDAQGNLTRALGDARYRSVRYNSFNLPQGDGVTPGIVGVGSGGAAAPTYDWVYGETEQRLVELRKTSRGTRTTWTLHPDGANGLSYEQETDENGVTTNRHYLSAGATTVMLTTTAAAPATTSKLEYWHKDHLGSTVAVTVAGGADWRSRVKTIRYAYDPWGKRRYANGATDPANALIGDYHGGAPDAVNGTDRGFTGHEHLDDLGVIHMNARLYDPLIGRFMQADPVVGDPFDIQTYNAYSYVYNRPLNTVDADGKCPVCIGAIVGAIALHAMGIIDQQQMRMVVSIAVAVWLGPNAGPASWPAAGQAAAAGFVSGAIATGNFNGAAQGAFTSLAFYGAGSLGDGLSSSAAASGETGQAAYWSEKGLGRTMLHAGVGCITSVTGGGKCGAGAASAGAAQFLGARLKAGEPVVDTFIHAMIGGTASVLGGGKFASGAQSGAFGYVMNRLAHNKEAEAYIRELRARSPAAAAMLEAMAKDKNVLYRIDIGPVPAQMGGGQTTIIQPGPSLWSRIWGIAPSGETLVSVTVSPVYSTSFVDVNGNMFVPSTLRLLAHELGHAYNWLDAKGDFVAYRSMSDNAIVYENIIARELDANAPKRAISDHGRGP
jgi:RHS repeat-associated protein